MPHTADTALAWVKTKINKATTDKFRGYAVLDLVSFMGVIGSHSDDEWYKSYALLQYYNGLAKDKQDPYGKKYYPLVEKVALSNHNLVLVNGDQAGQSVVVDLWWIALGHPVADSICKLNDWGLKGQYDGEKGVSVKKIWNPTPGSAAWKDPAPKTPKR